MSRNLQPAEPQEAAKPRPAERVVTMTPIRRGMAERLVEAKNSSAQLSVFDEFDMAALTALIARYQGEFQARHEIVLGFMPFFVKAAVEGLQSVPELNAEIRGHDIVYRGACDIAAAVDMSKGIVAPALRAADRLTLLEI